MTALRQLAIWFLFPAALHAQSSGQLSSWIISKPDSSALSQAAVRYIPEFSWGTPFYSSSGDSVSGDVALNGLLRARFPRDSSARLDASVAAYRAWARFGSHHFETRIGLQKISFGSATLFRPLMWFDRVDPRDPLQTTNGVDAALARYYFANNANIWAWGLYGNNGATGWEPLPTEHHTVEFGGRVQSPIPLGEIGGTYDHRALDLTSISPNTSAPEDRFGLDAKWNLGIGLWAEGALVHERTPLIPAPYQRYGTVGADYTIGLGNGIYLLAETSRFDALSTAFGSSSSGTTFSGLLANYPIGILDRISAIAYANWSARQWYRIATWQRTYDSWTLYLLGFWNPNQITALGLAPAGVGSLQQSQLLSGRGLQLMAAVNY